MNRKTRSYLTIALAILLLVLLRAWSPAIQFAQQILHGSITTVTTTHVTEIVTPTTPAKNAIPIPIASRLPSPTPTPPVQPKPAPSSSGNGQTGGTSSGVSQAANAVFNQINAARAQAGLPALQWSNMLVNSAHKHNLAMMAGNQLSHQLPNEPELGTRISQAGVNWTFAAENIGESSDYLHPTTAATDLDQAMLNEKPPDDGHRQNILSNANTIGIDVLIDTQNQKVWLTEDFARTA
ncbi:MAG TPA: CAP domain-containing protein [Ktedonobacteraceae bacterium]|nr:CAP domain-containing protein [Ktedonobacteraceae bacterium]